VSATFVHLCVHSAYSLAEGAIRIKDTAARDGAKKAREKGAAPPPIVDLVALATTHSMPALALTDSANLFGALEFSTAMMDAGIQPILGARVHIGRPEAGRPGAPLAPWRMTLLVQDGVGWGNLVKLVSRHYLREERAEQPQIDLGALDGATDGLIALTGGLTGPVGRLLADGQGDAAAAMLDRLAALFPGRLYVELQRHDLADEDRIEPAMIDLAYDRGLPLIATNEVLFADRGMHEAHDALLCIAEGVTLSAEGRRRVTPEFRFKSSDEMAALFADLPEAIANTVVVARRCGFLLKPVKPVLPAFPCEPGTTEEALLRRLSAAGLDQRLAQIADRDPAPYRSRLAFELDVIVKMGFAGYFLIVQDFIGWAKDQGIPVGPGRGSGAGSVVAWALRITDLDPLAFGLLFERFLNPERVSMPDFDIDFCQERRDEVIGYVRAKYGQDRVAQIITFGKLQARAALRDVGRVLEMPFMQVDRICKLVPNNPANPVTLAKAIEDEPQLRQMADAEPAIQRLIEIALRLEGLYRNASTHAAGIVIGNRPLDELVPLYRDPKSDMPATQFNMKWVELAGLVKFDFLGLKTLSVIARAEAFVRARDPDFDLARAPLDDATTYIGLARGDGAGVFQFESAGMRDALRRVRPNRIEDLVAVGALYRPGPMENIPTYADRKHGREEPDYLHPKLRPILEETFGIMIYQEQVMEVAQRLAGYSLGGADLLRRAMGKKDPAEMAKQRAVFVEGAAANDIEAATAGAIFEQMEKFAGYGFNKSHAAAYGVVSFQTAYLKANHPVAFFAALMTFDINDTDKLNFFRQELERLGIRLLPPDIQTSDAAFSVERLPDGGDAVRYALAALKGVGEAGMRALVRARAAGGPFASLGDLVARVEPRAINRKALEQLVQAGAFDTLSTNRKALHAAMETVARLGAARANAGDDGQVSLFGGSGAIAVVVPTFADWLPHERLQKEFEAFGFYFSAHPLDEYADALRRLGALTYREAGRRAAETPNARTPVKIGAMVLGRNERTAKSGQKFCYLQLTDTTGVFECAVFSELLPQARALSDDGRPIMISADARPDGDGVRLSATALQPLDDIARDASAGIRIHVADTTAVGGLHGLLTGGVAAGRGEVVVVVDAGDDEIEIILPVKVQSSPALRRGIKSLPGVLEVREL
jgi:DNA polymerase-3 subunit alpha